MGGFDYQSGEKEGNSQRILIHMLGINPVIVVVFKS